MCLMECWKGFNVFEEISPAGEEFEKDMPKKAEKTKHMRPITIKLLKSLKLFLLVFLILLNPFKTYYHTVTL